MIYYTLTSLGCETTGFLHNNPVPVNPFDWYMVNDTDDVKLNATHLKLTYNGVTSDIKVLKAREKIK